MPPAVSSSASSQALRFATPQNQMPTGDGVAASTTFTSVRTRMGPFYIGSGDMSELRLSFNGWYLAATDATNYGNAYSIVKCALEKDAGTFATVLFSGGRTKTINAGDVDIQSDAILPSSFSLSKFTRGEKYWIRLEYSVASTGLILPRGDIAYSTYGFPASVGLALDSGGSVVDPVDGTGTMTFTSGWANFANPMIPLVLGRQVSGDVKTFIGLGDSIMNGSNDTLSGHGLIGMFSQALTDSDLTSNPIGGCDFGSSGSKSSLWSATNAAKPKAFLKYAKYAVEEFGTNEFNVGNGALASAETNTAALWTACYANGIAKVIRTKLTPRTTSTDSWATTGNQTFTNAAWQAGGDGRLFNDWLDTQIGAGKITDMVNLTSQRVGSNQTLDTFYQWNVNGSANFGTSDGTHPSPANHILAAAELRTVFSGYA